jgi:hypothetical protein
MPEPGVKQTKEQIRTEAELRDYFTRKNRVKAEKSAAKPQPLPAKTIDEINLEIARKRPTTPPILLGNEYVSHR